MLQAKLGDWDDASVHRRSRLSHIVRRQQRPDAGWVEVPINLEVWHLEEPLPSPSEQLDQLIIFVGDSQPSAAESAPVSPYRICAWIGARIKRGTPDNGFGWLVAQAPTKALLEDRGTQDGMALLRLRLEGWERYESLKRGRVESRNVLMAMKFNDPELDQVVEECFRPAVHRAGFNLRVLTDNQPAGLIDNQLRVALRTSRFIVADVTHGSNGAYWEAGYVEGMSRPVIYTCREAEWEEQKVHFDTNHLVTILWDVANLQRAATQLTATIRATLPEEAKMTDD